MLIDRKEEQGVLFKEIMLKRMTVRETEMVARKIAFERARKVDRNLRPDIIEIEEKIAEALGTRVSIEQKLNGGKIVIDYSDETNLRDIMEHIQQSFREKAALGNPIAETTIIADATPVAPQATEVAPEDTHAVTLDDRSSEEKKEAEEESYDLKNFTI